MVDREFRLGDKELWRELESFAAEKKSPVGYRPFADVALKGGNKVRF